MNGKLEIKFINSLRPHYNMVYELYQIGIHFSTNKARGVQYKTPPPKLYIYLHVVNKYLKNISFGVFRRTD